MPANFVANFRMVRGRNSEQIPGGEGEKRNAKKRISIDEQQSEKCQSTVISQKQRKRRERERGIFFCLCSFIHCLSDPLNDAIPTWLARPEIVNGNVLLGVRLS